MAVATPRWFWLACVCLILVALGPRGTLGAQTSLTLRSAQFLLDDAATPPPDERAWRAQQLPDNWNLSRPGVGGFGWYRMHFELPARPEQVYAVYLRKLSMNATIYINNEYVGDGGRLSEPVARHWNRPLLFSVPPALLRSGTNVLHVRLWAYPNSRGGLDEIRIGPRTELHPVYERRYFVQTILPQLCNIVVAALGLFALAMWVRRQRTESTYVFFFVFSLLWAFRSTHMFIRDIPVPAFYWDIWVQSSHGWCTLLFIVLAMRYSGVRWPRFDLALVAYGLLGPFAMYLAGPAQMHAVANNWSFVLVPVAIFFEGFLIREAWRARTIVSALLAGVWALIIAASTHDGLVHRSKLAFDSFYLTSYVMVLLSFVMGWLLVRRFVSALDTAEKLNLELEQRVAQKHAELEHNFRQLQEMQHQTAIAEERGRLMSEMHDGVGSQVIATLDAVERGHSQASDIARDLRDILDSLRLTIDSLQPSENDLLTVLGNLRYRLEGRLKRQGIKLNWQVSDVPKVESLTPQNVLHILRILQEAFTNIIKHARASTITVTTGFDAAHVHMSVADDGGGFRGEREGRGLSSMRRRAQQLGAQLEINSSPSGTVLSLRIPVDAQPALAAGRSPVSA
jgi:signal transduction histidine kinase